MKEKGAMMVAIVVMVAMLLSLVLVLLAELYCTLLLRKRRLPNTPSASSTVTTVAATSHPDTAPSLCSFYAQGVIRAPRSFLFPAPPPEKRPFHLRYSSRQETASPDSSAADDDADQLVYICNPMYDGEAMINIGMIDTADTPYETPSTSPSHLDIETGSSSGGGSSPATSTPPLTPMKKIPAAEGGSVSLRDGGISICTTPSDSNTVDGGISSSSSASPSTSPSW